MKTIQQFLIIFATSSLLLSCHEVSESEKITPENLPKTETKSEDAPSIETPHQTESEIRQFLHSSEGTYGWQTTFDSISYDYFDDGRLHIQGPDGEATMWSGTWKLIGDQLTMVCKDINKNETLTVKIDGEKLILGEKMYTRYKPN